MKQYRGPYSINNIEAAIGDFTHGIMKTVESDILYLDEGEQQLTTVGYLWDCGCEVRGGGGVANLPAALWSPCRRHDELDQPIRDVPQSLRGDIIVSRAVATMIPGHVLVIRGDQIYQRPVETKRERFSRQEE